MNYPSSSNLLWGALLAIAVSTGTSAIAAPTPSDIATARKLVAEGRKLRSEKDYVHAIEKLRAAYQLYPTAVTGDELALAYRGAGRFIEARETAIAVGRMPIEADEGNASKAARADCTTMVTELAKKIGQVVLTIQGAAPGAQLTVTLDGSVVPMAAIAEAHMVDPGMHVAIVSMASASDQRVEFEVAEGENKKVLIQAPLLIVTPPSVTTATTTTSATPAPSSLPSSVEPPPSTTTKDAPTTRTGSGWLTYVGFGVAGAGVLVGSITGVQAIGTANRLSGKCDGSHICNPSEQSDVNKLNTVSTISTISFVVAGVGLFAAIIDMTTSLTAEPRPITTTASTSTPVRVSVGLGALTLAGEF